MREQLAGYLAGWKDQETALRSSPDPVDQAEIRQALFAFKSALLEGANLELVAERLEREAVSLEQDAAHSLATAEDYKLKLTLGRPL